MSGNNSAAPGPSAQEAPETTVLASTAPPPIQDAGPKPAPITPAGIPTSLEYKPLNRTRNTISVLSKPPPIRGVFAAALDVPSSTHKMKPYSMDIHAVPDTRNYTYLLSKVCALTFAKCDFGSFASVSPATFTGYCLWAFYAKLLLIDLGSEKPSYYAQQIRKNEILLSTVESFKDLIIPDFVAEALAALAPYVLDSKTARFLPTLGLFDFDTDAGFLPPPMIYINAHNALTGQGSSTIESRVAFGTPILEYTPPNGTARIYDTNDWICKHFHETDQGNTTYYDVRTWLVSAFNKFTLNYTYRQNTRRPLFEEIRTTIYTADSLTFNPYIYYLCIWPEFKDSALDLIEECSKFCFTNKEHWRSTTIESTFNASPTVVCHALSQIRLPTWDGSGRAAGTAQDPRIPARPAVNTQPTATTKASLSQYATYWDFRINNKGYPVPPLPQAERPVASSAYYRRTDMTVPVEFPSKWLLTADNATTDNTIAKKQLFDADRDYYQDIMYFAPTEDLTMAHNNTIVAGFAIYNDNVDTISLVLPDTNRTIRSNQLMFLQSSIPMSYMIRHFTSTTSGVPDLSRVPFKVSTVTAQWCLYFRNYIFQQLVGTATTHMMPSNITPSYRAPLPNSQRPLSNVVVHSAGGSLPADEASKKMNTFLWSSYRWTFHHEVNHKSIPDKVYLMPSLVPIFGYQSSFVTIPPVFELYRSAS